MPASTGRARTGHQERRRPSAWPCKPRDAHSEAPAQDVLRRIHRTASQAPRPLRQIAL